MLRTRRPPAWSAEGGGRKLPGVPTFPDATRTVFGHGPSDAAIVLVGEQPGDQEVRAGLPFVGLAAWLLARALDEAGVDAELTYQANA